MSNEKKFIVRKDDKTDVITYMEYEKLKGFSVKPKKNAHFEDMINVNEMVVINPSLIEKLVDKKCHRTLERILLMLSVINEDDSDDSAPFELIIDEISHFKKLLINKYAEYMNKEEYKLLLKKLEIIEREVELRKSFLIQRMEQIPKKNKNNR